jgi:hypothetical protein
MTAEIRHDDPEKAPTDIQAHNVADSTNQLPPTLRNNADDVMGWVGFPE